MASQSRRPRPQRVIYENVKSVSSITVYLYHSETCLSRHIRTAPQTGFTVRHKTTDAAFQCWRSYPYLKCYPSLAVITRHLCCCGDNSMAWRGGFKVSIPVISTNCQVFLTLVPMECNLSSFAVHSRAGLSLCFHLATSFS